VLREPALPEALVDREPEGELLEPHGIAGVLRVHAVDRVAPQVDVDAPPLDVPAPAALVPLPGGVDEEHVLQVGLLEEDPVAAAVEDVLAVNDVRRVCHLDAVEAEGRALGPVYVEADEHLATPHHPPEELGDLCEPLAALQRVHHSLTLASTEEYPRVALVPGQVEGAVEVHCVPGVPAGYLLPVLKRPPPHVLPVLRRACVHEDRGRLRDEHHFGNVAQQLLARYARDPL